jgi:hypothetical protein
MGTCKFLTACVFVGIAAAVALAQPRERVPILATFEGTVANDKKPDLKTGFVATEAKWKEVWAKVNPKEKLPKVDFAKHFLLVMERDAADPNYSRALLFKNNKGTVTVDQISTLIGFEASNQTTCRFYKVSRGRDGGAALRPGEGEVGGQPSAEVSEPSGPAGRAGGWRDSGRAEPNAGVDGGRDAGPSEFTLAQRGRRC